MQNLFLALVLATGTPQIRGLLIGFLVLVIILAVIAGLLWCIENWINPVPPMVKLVLAIVLVILIILWALEQFGIV
jgi:hypothetical protein